MTVLDPNSGDTSVPCPKVPEFSGLELLKVALSSASHQFSLTTQLAMRCTCSELKSTVNHFLTTALFFPDTNNPDPDNPDLDVLPLREFSVRGWPASLQVLHCDISSASISVDDLSTLLQCDLPCLREISINIPGIRGTREHQDAELFVQRVASCAGRWPTLRSLSFPDGRITGNMWLELLDAQWSVTHLCLCALHVGPIGEMLPPQAWQAAFPHLEELDLSTPAYHKIPQCLLRADTSTTLKTFALSAEIRDIRIGQKEIDVFKGVAWLKHLVELTLEVHDVDLSPIMDGLRGSTSLKSLKINMLNQTTVELPASNVGGYRLPSLQNLKYLYLYTQRGFELFEAICGVHLPAIEVLECMRLYSDPSVKFSNFAEVQLSSMPHLTHLAINFSLNDEGLLRFLQVVSKLEVVICPSECLSKTSSQKLEQFVEAGACNPIEELTCQNLTITSIVDEHAMLDLVSSPFTRKMEVVCALVLPLMSDACMGMLAHAACTSSWSTFLHVVSVQFPHDGYVSQVNAICIAAEAWDIRALFVRGFSFIPEIYDALLEEYSPDKLLYWQDDPHVLREWWTSLCYISASDYD